MAEDNDEDVTDLKDLAHRLSQTFGIEASGTEAGRERRDQARKARRFLHQEAIKYSLAGLCPVCSIAHIALM